MKKVLLSLMLLACCFAGHAYSLTVINNTGCDFNMTFGIYNPSATSSTVTLPPGTTVYPNPGAVPATWSPVLTPAQLASASFLYAFVTPVASSAPTFLLRAGNGGYNSILNGYFPPCYPSGFIANWNVNASNDVVILIF